MISIFEVKKRYKKRQPKPFDQRYIPEPNSGCWLWLGKWNFFGYGIFLDSQYAKDLKAHRVSWELHRGPIPVGMNVLHKCDTPPCVNPSHLYIGTRSDNARDMVCRGRSTRGEKNPYSKLTMDDVIDIRKLARSGSNQRDIAQRFNVNPSQISRINTGERWGWMET